MQFVHNIEKIVPRSYLKIATIDTFLKPILIYMRIIRIYANIFIPGAAQNV